MRFIGNLIWFLFGGLATAFGWMLAGLIWCCTIIGIPIGVQCFKFAGLVLWPFGKEVRNNGKVGSFILNILWFFISGIELALCHFLLGLLFYITIIGIPFGKQHMKLAKLAIMPFGSAVI